MSQTSVEQTDGRDKRGRFAPGNQAARKHGAYSYWVAKRVPKIRGIRKIQKNLDRMRKELESAIPEMTVQKQILVDQVMKTHGFIVLFELYARRMGLFDPESGKKGRLDFMPGFKVYLSMLNSQRNALTMLGIDVQNQERILTPLEITQKESEHGQD